MVERSNDEFLLLAATLLDQLSSSLSILEQTLLQLQGLFGPMLLSALQIIDRREVVHVQLPQGRSLYQITSSTGTPYTLYLDFPPQPPQSTQTKEVEEKSSTAQLPEEMDPAVQMAQEPRPAAEDPGLPKADLLVRQRFIRAEAKMMARIFCPCPGFAYNSLAGDRNVLCKHLLAAVISHKLGKQIRTEVSIHGVVPLLGLSTPTPPSGDAQSGAIAA